MDIGFGVLEYYGMGVIPLSLMFRVSIMAAFVVVMFKQNDLQAWYIKSIMVIWLCCLCFWMVDQGSIPLFDNVNLFLRTLYPMSISLLIGHALWRAYDRGDDVRELIFTGIIYYGLVASLSILFSFVTGIGRLTYGEWAFGIKSFFVGGNDIGIALLVALIFSWVRFLKNGGWLSGITTIAITLSVSLIGSRAGWGGVVGITFTFAVVYVLFKRADSYRTYLIKVLIVGSVVGTGVFVTKLVYDNFDTLSYHIEKVTELMEGVSPREKLERAGQAVLDRRGTIDNILGQGATYFYNVYDEFTLKNRTPKDPRPRQLRSKQVEQDVMDLYGMFGIILTSLVLLYHLFFWLLACRLFYHYRNVLYFGCLMSVTLYIFHGIMAGHAIASPQVSTLIGSVYGFLLFQQYQQSKKVQA
jgi:hypothetical protein